MRNRKVVDNTGAMVAKPWQRHVTTMDTTDGVKVLCARCGLQLPLMVKLGSIVLTKEDRCFLGDDQKAVDCGV